MRLNGFWAVVFCYIIWGLYPLYFHSIQQISPAEIVCCRVIFSLMLILPILLALGRGGSFWCALKSRKTLLTFLLSTALITINWSVYTYSIVSNQALEASLGYFMNPLISVFLGMIFLREELSRAKKFSLCAACAGVLWLTVQTGSVPVIAAVLALSFGLYGLVRKIAPLCSLEGLTLETAMAFPAALAVMFFMSGTGDGLALINGTLFEKIMLICAGALTVLPFLLFGYGLQKIPYSTVGFIQFLSPTMIFFIGVFVFGEPLDTNRLIGFVMIWAAIGIFVTDSLGFWKKSPSAAVLPDA